MIWLLWLAVVGLTCWNVNLRRRLELVELGPTKEQVDAIVQVQNQKSAEAYQLAFQLARLEKQLAARSPKGKGRR